MSGISYLLDTNFILGILKSSPSVQTEVSIRQIRVDECAYSAITRMELLGFPGITQDEELLIKLRLGRLSYLPLSSAVEDKAIVLRRTHTIKLPDAIIAATALCFGLELLTLDKRLFAIVQASTELGIKS